MKIGTSHFQNFQKAITYYSGYSYGSGEKLKNYVQAKINRGEISIGPPEVKKGEALSLNAEGRYMIEYKEGE